MEDELQSEEREDTDLQTEEQLEPEKNSETETKEHPSIIPTPQTAVTSQKPSTIPVQAENFLILDQNGQSLCYERLVIMTGQTGQLYGVQPLPQGGAQMLLPHGQVLDIAQSSGVFVEKTKPQAIITSKNNNDDTDSSVADTAQSVIGTKIQSKDSPDVFVTPLKPLPAGAPNWALRLRECEKIGDSYRGYCNTEAEMEAILQLHKQQTHTVFGTRQSPSPAKPATRLMWKSQYVPYDGIPFVNAGSRAIVMECQFGPRRKGAQPKKGPEQETNQYKATCPARIYIKKVRKFPEHKVPTDPKVDRKVVRQEQEKAFFNLRKSLWDAGGVVRYYIQLPTEKAHLYHNMDSANLPPLPEQIYFEEEHQIEAEDTEVVGIDAMQDVQLEDGTFVPSRLHPLVAEKICNLVAQGHNQVYSVRKQLRYDSDQVCEWLITCNVQCYSILLLAHRRFVEREMFKPDEVPERHNLCYFPTVNDIKNHIHEAQKALHLTPEATSDTEWKADADNLIPDTVTLTLTPATVEVSSQKGALLEGIDTHSPEAVQLFSSLTSLQPKFFTQVQLQPALSPAEATAKQPPATLEPLDPSSPLLLSPSQFLQSSPSPGESTALCDAPAVLNTNQLVNVTSVTNTGTDGDITQMLLKDGKTIPVQIVDVASIDNIQMKVDIEKSLDASAGS
nr:calcium-responsive transcription factor isoform X1 [Misgurnus anguillicaudatus]XP_055072215.1 calcium-responsive transcription factor isoform X1 [Misgurnus anguillicaudatus]